MPGIKNKVADAASRFPTGPQEHLELAALHATNERLTREVIRASFLEPLPLDIKDSVEVEQAVEADLHAALLSISIGGSGGQCHAVTWRLSSRSLPWTMRSGSE